MADRKVLGFDPSVTRPAVHFITVDETGKIQPDYMGLYRRQRELVDDVITISPKENKPSGYYEFHVGKHRSGQARGNFIYLSFNLPHQMPPGFPFHDIPTSLMVADAPMIQCLRQFGLMHMMDHVPLARDYFGSMRKRGLRVWAR